ncbi:hypothetical protein [Brevundimonas sp.]|jgi:hypothetical protein|uniref:hypothetical protein n=1 Tax=Brevundimonas sp. TaxID=1871086 RepID=UPI00391BF1B2|nr:hypothetical protein [Brevundimonas sp.]
MNVGSLARSLTPLGWLTLILVCVATVALLLGGLGFRWDPFDLARRRADRAEAAADLAHAEAVARAAEAEGQSGQVARLDTAHTIIRRTEAATTPILLEARTAHDADLPLSPDRLDRLRAHDDELCRIAPDLGGCPATPDPARDRRPAL